MHPPFGLVRRRIVTAVVAFVVSCPAVRGARAQPAPFDLRLFQPEIVTDVVPERPLRGSYGHENNTGRVGLSRMRAQVPSHDGKGLLIASWTPHPQGAADRPTFVIVHHRFPICRSDAVTEDMRTRITAFLLGVGIARAASHRAPPGPESRRGGSERQGRRPRTARSARSLATRLRGGRDNLS
jgi:hypothetical protein